MKELAQFDLSKPVIIDTESISWDDERGGLKPYHGDRVAGLSVTQGDVSHYWQIRHRTDVAGCYDFGQFKEHFTAFAKDVTQLANVNVKFDMHMLWQDGVTFPKARILDIGTLCRVVKNDRMSYNLRDMANDYCKFYFKDVDELAAWTKANNTRDYGAIPIPIISRYAKFDGLSAYELYQQLLGRLPEASKGVWSTENKYCKYLWQSENIGFKIDRERLKLYQAKFAYELESRMSEIRAMAGYDLNPASSKQVHEYFSKQGIEPVAFNKQKDGTTNPSWSKDALSQIPHSMAQLLMKYNSVHTNLGTFAKGWHDAATEDGTIHGSFNPAGTVTGRSSSSDPNLQNPPKWMYECMLIPDDQVGVKYDYSQIEYRIFTHYSEDPALLKSYADDPRTDLHQLVANRMGVNKHRDLVKKINFGVIYGMGQAKTKRTIARIIWEVGDGSLMEKLSKQFKTNDLNAVADAFLAEYHTTTPSIRKLGRSIKAVIDNRGTIRNFYGRYYNIDSEHHYMGLNYLCQGSAADMFKERTVAVYEACENIGLRFRPIINIHDSAFTITHPDDAAAFWAIAAHHAVQCNFKVPVLIDGDIALKNWKTLTRIKDSFTTAWETAHAT